MDDNTVKTGSGGSRRRFITKRNLMFVGLVVLVLLIAGGAGVGLRMLQTKNNGDTSTTTTGKSLPQTISDAQDLRTSGDTAAADKKINDALNDSKTSSSDRYLLLIQKGAGYYDQQKYADAITALEQAAAIKQTSEVYDMMGDAYAGAGQKDKAIEAYKKAIPLLPNTPVQADDKEAIQNKIRNLGGEV
jgi:tetratricopeptide (TPR) repeat protein